MKSFLSLTLALPLLAALSLSSCTKKNLKTESVPAQMVSNTQAIPTLDVEESSSTASTEPDIRGGDFAADPSIKSVYFDFDKYDLSDADQATLQANAEVLKEHKDWTVLVAGNCDDRGTIEYNLALGQRRAKTVRDYYVRLGVPENSVGTISYGEEKPVCTEENEACWHQNRRADTEVKGQ